jgi:hypothetical protein
MSMQGTIEEVIALVEQRLLDDRLVQPGGK